VAVSAHETMTAKRLPGSETGVGVKPDTRQVRNRKPKSR
jgi:hypothetical protein